MSAKRSARDTVNPCKVCGWAEHMAIHHQKSATIGHAYVSPNAPRPFANQQAKPPATASLFTRAAWFLADYAKLWYETGPHGDEAETADNDARCEEMTALAVGLRELDGEWEAKREAGTTASAASIVADMLKDWRLPGAVWYLPRTQRWRVTGESYRAEDGEVCVGVYAPGVHAYMLKEDFDAVSGETASRCSAEPGAPHGFDRNGSHSEGRYVCECESWTRADSRTQTPKAKT